MLDLQLPARHDWVVQEKNYGKLVMEPFEPGFALTVGIAYRRVLLSAIRGAAPTWVKIERVLHQFSHLPGVTEDTLDIMMNLRKVAFVLHVNRPKILRLKAQGPGTVTASDFEKDADIEILTPEVPLATLDKDSVLEMEVCVEHGRGYVPAEKREPEAGHPRDPARRRLLAGRARELPRRAGRGRPGAARPRGMDRWQRRAGHGGRRGVAGS